MRIHSATRPAVAGERSGVTRVLRFLSLALLLAVAGCGGSDDAPAAEAPPAAAPAEASAVIGAAGGTLNGPDGVQLVVPPGALTQDTTLRIARSGSGAPSINRNTVRVFLN